MLSQPSVRKMRVLPLCNRVIRDESLADHFAPGNIIWIDYWHTHDRVIRFRGGDDWSVVVEEVQLVEGQWTAVGPHRCHATYPSNRDVVVYREGGAA